MPSERPDLYQMFKRKGGWVKGVLNHVKKTARLVQRDIPKEELGILVVEWKSRKAEWKKEGGQPLRSAWSYKFFTTSPSPEQNKDLKECPSRSKSTKLSCAIMIFCLCLPPTFFGKCSTVDCVGGKCKYSQFFHCSIICSRKLCITCYAITFSDYRFEIWK